MAPFESASKQGMLAYAAPNLYQPHQARQAIRDAHEKKIPPLLFYYAGLSSVPLTRFLAPMGYDGVWIDWEHTPCNVETMTDVGLHSPVLCIPHVDTNRLSRWCMKPFL